MTTMVDDKGFTQYKNVHTVGVHYIMQVLHITFLHLFPL